MSSAIVQRWLLRCLTWDGVLPATIWLIPFLIRWLLPGVPGALVAAAVALPISAFMVRLYLGGYYIECNDCARVTKGFQTLLLFVGLFMLLFIDALMIVADDLFPKGALVANWKTIIFLGSLYAIYFTIMGLAMYPGIPKSADRIDQAS